MTFCSVCKAHGQDDDICKTHMFDSWRKCRYHDRYAGDDKLQVTVTSTAAADSVAPDISVTMPRTPSKAPRPSATVDDASSAPSGAGTWTGPEILSKLFSNELSRNAAVGFETDTDIQTDTDTDVVFVRHSCKWVFV